jgi:hypothetical protein
MTWWNVSTKEKKQVFEHELWQKDDWVIRRITGYRWGTIQIETNGNEPPVLDQTDGPGADAVDVNMTDYNYEPAELTDSWYEDFVWPDEMPEEERDRLLQLWEDEFHSGWEEDGWEYYETECWFHGPLEIVLDGVQVEVTSQPQESLEIKESTLDNDWPFPDPVDNIKGHK